MDSKSDIACINKLRPTTTVTAKQLSDDPEKTVDIVGPSRPRRDSYSETSEATASRETPCIFAVIEKNSLASKWALIILTNVSATFPFIEFSTANLPLAIRHASDSITVPPAIVFRWFSLIVVPEEVISAIMSANPMAGATSRVPLDSTMEKLLIPFESRNLSTSLGDLVAILKLLPLFLNSTAISARSAMEPTSIQESGIPSASEQPPKPKSFITTLDGPSSFLISRYRSCPRRPKSAVPSSTLLVISALR